MTRAFRHIIQTLDKPLDVDFILNTYRLATKDVLCYVTVSRVVGNGWGIGFKTETVQREYSLRKQQRVCYEAYPETTTSEGLQEIAGKFSHLAFFDSSRTARADCPDDAIGFIVSRINEQEDILEAMQIILNEYNNSNKNFLAIATMVHSLCLLHPFSDGNIRTMVFLIMNKVLIENYGIPITLDDPNIFDGLSCKELAIILEKEALEQSTEYKEQVRLSPSLV